jgi:hypothetical protein
MFINMLFHNKSMKKIQIYAIISLASILMLMATNITDFSTAKAASEQSCDNWTDRHIKSHERMDDGKLSNGDIQSHDNGIKNRDNVCR